MRAGGLREFLWPSLGNSSTVSWTSAICYCPRRQSGKVVTMMLMIRWSMGDSRIILTTACGSPGARHGGRGTECLPQLKSCQRLVGCRKTAPGRQFFSNAMAGEGVHGITKFCTVLSDFASQGENHEDNVSSCGRRRDCIPHGLNSSVSTAMGIPAASSGSSPSPGQSTILSNLPLEPSGHSSPARPESPHRPAGETPFAEDNVLVFRRENGEQLTDAGVRL